MAALDAEATRDADLARAVVAARAGDRGAFGELYRRCARFVHGVLLSRVAAADADDLVHEVFLFALERLPTLRDPNAFGPWIAAIARTKAVDHYRRRRPSEPLGDREPLATAADASVTAEARRALRAIAELPEAYRETLVLRLVEGMTGPEIAAATGLSPGSVRVNLHRGFHLLRQRLEEGGGR